ncbi:MAG: PD-(D/E)XK nuclease family protein [Phycisphaerae bacterium]|nr:PD-(D/E)XK nuclease family protein [Phycisphaerae bacterium]
MDSNALRERILTANGPAVVLRGPAACGKTAAALDLYRHFVGGTGRPACLLIAPNAAAARDLRRRLLVEAPAGVVVAPGVRTFAQLGAAILADADDAARLLSPVARRCLLRRIVDEGTTAGDLPALAPAADTPGMTAALDRAIAELKRAAVEPDALARAVADDDGKGRDLATVYARYQQAMQAGGVYDVEGQLWQARERLRASEGLGALSGVEAVAVDGFTDFTPTQLAILSLLAPRLRRLLITLPHARDGRGRLWHWTERTLAALRRTFGDGLSEIALDDRKAGLLSGLVDALFDFDAAPRPMPEALDIIAAAGVDAEVAAVARRIKRRLLSGTGERIAVIARDLAAYREPIERIFGECDIPVAAAPCALADEPIVRFALDVASLAPTFAFADVLSVLAGSYFRPEALGGFNADTVAAAQTLIRDGNVLEGRDAYGRTAVRFARQADRAAASAADDDEDARTARGSAEQFHNAAAMLERLFDVAERARRDGPVTVIDALGLRRVAAQQASPDLAARDLRAVSALEAAAGELDGATDPADVREALEPLSVPPPRTEALVDVLDVLDARPLRYDHVFLLGCGEGQFPRGFVDSAVLSEPQRDAWADRGVVLDSRRDLDAREMLLFYLAVSRADRHLTLSYMDTDATGRAGAPGSFLRRLVQPVGDDATGRGLEAAAVAARSERIGPGHFLCARDELASRRDARVAAAAGAFAADYDATDGALAWLAANEPHTPARAARGLWTLHRRAVAEPCDAYDGRIAAGDLRARLARRYGNDAVFSAAQLNAYGQCPWRFFAAYVLRLEPVAEPQRRLEPVARGVFCHNVLYRAMTALRDALDGPVRLSELPPERIDAVLADAVAAEDAAVGARRPPYPELWRVQRDALAADLARYLHQAAQPAVLNAASVRFELGFGLGERRVEELRDDAERDEPVVVETPDGPLKLRGRIDRVDRVCIDGREGVFVVDYKTGRLPQAKDIPAGRSLQLPLYAAAAETLLDAPSLGGAFHRVAGAPDERTFAPLTRRGAGYQRNKDYAAQREEALAAAARFVARIRHGRFDALPTHECPSWCAYRQVCHYAPWRAERKRRGEEGAS